MKKIIRVFLLLLLFLGTTPVYAKGVSIESITVDSKSNNTVILEDATIENLTVKMNVNFVLKEDYIKYKIIINNDTDKDYIMDENKNKSEYIDYIYEYDDQNKIIESHKKSTMFVTIQYKKEVPVDVLREEGSFIETKNLSIELDHFENPKTGMNIIAILLLLLIVGILLLAKKNKKIAVLILLLLPVTVWAIDKLMIHLEMNVKISAKPVCIRGTEKHVEVCNAYGYGSGDLYCSLHISVGTNIYYGNLGVNGLLTTGDIFNCDVNDDGIYDEETERFYYIAPEEGDASSNKIVLLYYNNVVEGVPNNKGEISFCNNDRNYAPTSAYTQLPTTAQWKNPLLFSNFERQIKTKSGANFFNHDGTTYNLPVFTYTNRVARIPTYREIVYGGCAERDLESTCNFLLENTTYTENHNGTTRGYYLESYADTIFYVYNVSGSPKMISTDVCRNASSGVRPAIVVLKDNILY
ncbi:MAG: hypothetical protein J6X28_03290 [Bacilli bacterium]|nr:hypothetical protein [Bacilli bacterium]